MFEKVNPYHPDKVADRIAGAIVDLAYNINDNPHIAVEVLVGHGSCFIIMESDVKLSDSSIKDIVYRIVGHIVNVSIVQVPQDRKLNINQEIPRCGDNGIFKGSLVTREQTFLSNVAWDICKLYQSDGKYIIRMFKNNSEYETIICQSNVNSRNEIKLTNLLEHTYSIKHNIINPIGEWSGGIDVDSGATNRKLGSDMGDSVTGGGLHGKDLSKADVSMNIFAWLAVNDPDFIFERTRKLIFTDNDFTCTFSCAIGDEFINEIPYSTIINIAREYIKRIGGFESFAEWGLIRPYNVSWNKLKGKVI